jgi:hypothetical protein
MHVKYMAPTWHPHEKHGKSMVPASYKHGNGPGNEWERQWKTLHGKDMATGDMATAWQRAFQRSCTMHAQCTTRAFEGL